MLSSFVNFLKRFVQIIFVVGLIFILAPVILQKITKVDLPTSIPPSIVIENPGAVMQTIIAEIEKIQNFAVAEYTGVVFLRETIPASFIGIDIYDIDLWKHIPGSVRASIDLQDYDWEQNISIRSDSVFICLPSPKIDTVEIFYDEVVEGTSSVSTPIESAHDLGMIEDGMYLQAETLLIEKAWEAGILEVSRIQAVLNTEAVVHAISGDSITVIVTFETPATTDGVL